MFYINAIKKWIVDQITNFLNDRPYLAVSLIVTFALIYVFYKSLTINNAKNVMVISKESIKNFIKGAFNPNS